MKVQLLSSFAFTDTSGSLLSLVTAEIPRYISEVAFVVKTTGKGKKVVSTSKTLSTKSSLDMNWRDQKTAEQCLSHLCLSEHLSDISFTFKGDQHVKLSAHKFILSMRSAVFEAMFYGSFAESGDTVIIEDIDPEAMKNLLRFVYSDKPGLDGNNVLSCLYAAKKYALTGLVKQCSEFLENNIDTNNVCSIHEQAAFYDMKCLQEKCFNYILENASGVFSTRGFLQISHDTLLNLLKQDELSIDEEHVFNATVRWSKSKSKAKQLSPEAKNLRECLGDALFEIRFPVMPIKIFATVVTPTGILTSEELIMLYQFNATKGSSPLGKFVSRERSGSATTIDVTQYTRSQYQGHQYGYVLQIQRQYNNQYDFFEDMSPRVPSNGPSFKVKSITGTFVQYVRRITTGNNPVTNYRSVGNKITFQNPIEMSNGGMIQFHVCARESYESYDYLEEEDGCMSYLINIQEHVNGSTITITEVPVGTETISFVK